VKLKLVADELAEHRFFSRLPQDLRERLADCAHNVVFDTGGQVLREGLPADSFFAIRAGRVAVGVRAPNGGLGLIETLHAGDILGWSWLFPPYRWHFDAVAIEPVRAVELHADCIRAYLAEHPQAGYELVRSIAEVMEERLESARMRLLDLYGRGDDAHG
jgi:CRP/FNR family transcriptional regulator, cyclic AMP receptor protein